MTTPYATPALHSQPELVFSLIWRNRNDSAFKFSELSRINPEGIKTRAEEVDILQQVHSTNLKAIKQQRLDLTPYKDVREVLLAFSEDAAIV